MPTPDASHATSKGKLGSRITGAFVIFFLNFLKCFGGCRAPSKLTLLHAVGNWRHYCVEVSGELPIEGGKSTETAHLMNVPWFLPFYNGLDRFHGSETSLPPR